MCQELRNTKLNKLVLAFKELLCPGVMGNANMKKEAQDALEVQRKDITESRVMKIFVEEEKL